jgi:hypothetical protein
MKLLEERRSGQSIGLMYVELESVYSHRSRSQIEPSPLLNFQDCYDSSECARLEVPLDWRSPEKDKRRAAIAVVKIPAKVPVTDSRYGGSVLINPGMIWIYVLIHVE